MSVDYRGKANFAKGFLSYKIDSPKIVTLKK